jgi:hypothetical protein
MTTVDQQRENPRNETGWNNALREQPLTKRGITILARIANETER